MPVTRPSPRVRLLALAVSIACGASVAQAQTLPRRIDVEPGREGAPRGPLQIDRRELLIVPGVGVLAPIDGGRLVDLRSRDGTFPDVWTTQGGALLRRHTAQDLDVHNQVVDTLGTGRRWLRLQSPVPTRVRAQVRVDGQRGGSDPWLVPLRPQADAATRTRPGRRDHVVRLDAQPLRLPVEDRDSIRLELWRAQRPRLLPADASWLRVEADGTALLDARVPTPLQRELLHVTDGCAEVLDLAGRVRIDLPPGTREVRIHGEPGTWLKALAPLPGTPAAARDVNADPERERVMQEPGESLESAFDRAVMLFPDPGAQAFLARHAYFTPLALRPLDASPIRTRLLRPRFPDRDARRTPPTNAPAAGEATIAPLAFHWLPAGARWRIEPAADGRLGLLRIAIVHPSAPAAAVQLRLEQAGQSEQLLRLDPDIVHALVGASSASDALLAVDPEGAPIVDASQAVLPRWDMATPALLGNTGSAGAWVAVEQRIPARRSLAGAALVPSLLAPERVQDALLTAPAGTSRDQAGAAGATRELDQARLLLAARAARFAEDPCLAPATPGPQAAGRALDILGRARDLDPVLARCAALRAVSAAPDDPDVQAAFAAWALDADQAELRTGALAWSLARADRRRDRDAWSGLAAALEVEGEASAAALARRAAGLAAGVPDSSQDARQAGQAAAQAAGLVRLRSERGLELAYALASTRVPAHWGFERDGPHVLELRATAAAPQWVRLSSGDRSWMVLVPAADAALTTLRDVATGAAPGLAVRVPFDVAGTGQALQVQPESADVLARVDGPAAGAAPTRVEGEASRRQRVGVDVAAACRVRHLRTELEIQAPTEPSGPPTPGQRPVDLSGTAPAVLVEAAAPATATQAALRALRLLDAGTPGAQAAAAAALAARDRAPGPASPGVFAELDRHVGWRLVVPDSHGGIRRRSVADGRSTNPLIARREAWAGIAGDAPFVLRAGQGWVLEGLQPGQRVRLTLRQRAALPGSVEIRTTQGDAHRLDGAAPLEVVDLADRKGELHLQVGEALPGSFVELDLADAAGAPLDGRRDVRYFLAPISLDLDAPTLLRIVEWDGRSSVVRTQSVPAAGRVRLEARHLPGAALRVSALELRPAQARDGATRPAVAPTLPVSAPVPYVPGLAQASTWPQHWPGSGGGDGTWGLLAGLQQRPDLDDPGDRFERFGELRWRWRWHAPERGLRGRLDLIGRRHDAGFGAVGLQHDLQWRQPGGPWGASLDVAAWGQAAPAGLDSPAHAATLRVAVDWSRRRDERWRDEWELGLRGRTLSLSEVPRALAAGLDNEVYSRYRDRHRSQLDLGYRLAWRARYDSEWILDARAVSNALADPGVDNVGGSLGWRWARHGWSASAGVDVRRYLRDDDRRAATMRRRAEVGIGRLWLGHDDGWRLRVTAGYDADAGQTYGGLSLEWFDHDGRGLDDFLPSEMFLRQVTETDLAAGLLAPDDLP